MSSGGIPLLFAKYSWYWYIGQDVCSWASLQAKHKPTICSKEDAWYVFSTSTRWFWAFSRVGYGNLLALFYLLKRVIWFAMFLQKAFNSCISFCEVATWFTPNWGGAGKVRGALRVGKASGNYCTRVRILARGGAIHMALAYDWVVYLLKWDKIQQILLVYRLSKKWLY